MNEMKGTFEFKQIVLLVCVAVLTIFATVCLPVAAQAAVTITVDAGSSIRLLENKVTIGMDLKKPRDNNVQYGLGGEYKQSLRGDFRFALRTGYTTAGTDANGTTGISLGAGLGYKQFDLDFAWVPFGDLGNTFRYAAFMRF